jgi:hypothetical protein
MFVKVGFLWAKIPDQTFLHIFNFRERREKMKGAMNYRHRALSLPAQLLTQRTVRSADHRSAPNPTCIKWD